MDLTRIRKTAVTVGSVVIGAAGTSLLLTERVHNDEQAGSWYRDFLARSPDGCLVVTDEERIVETNRAARRLLGVEESLCGTKLTTLLPDTEPLVAETDCTRVEFPFTTGASRQYLVATGLPVTDSEGPAEQVVTLRDTTDRRRSEKQSQRLLKHTSDLLVVVDSTGTITFANAAFERALGYAPETLEGRDLLTEIHRDDRATVEQALDTLCTDPETRQEFECRIQTDGGDWRILEGIGRNLLETPEVRGLLITARDITDRKQREHDLKRQNERLEEFASVVSHDLRNPLQIAKGYMEEARHSGDQASFDRVEAAHERIETIIQDVLTLARQGQSVGDTEPTELSAVASEAWQTVETPEATVTIQGDRTLEADSARLRQLFENLFRNAVEHAGPEVSVTVGVIEPMHTTTRIESTPRSGFFVADDGPGVPEDDRGDVFDSDFTTTNDGTGFGLAIVEQIAEAHRWEASVTTSRDGGARFEFVKQPEDQHLQPD